jgi:CHAD domain-containing protein
MDTSVARTGQRIVQRRAAVFLARAERAVGQGRDGELHAARIAAKRLRYNVEFFASQLGAGRDTALGLLALVQDRLGTIADAEAFVRAFEEMLSTLPPTDARAVGIVARIAACRTERANAIAAMRALWRGDGHSPYPEMLAASLASALTSSSKEE